MAGTVVQVSVSKGGIPKRAVACGQLTMRGFEGDGWAHPQIHGGPLQAVLLIAEEVLDKLRGAGFPVYPGALGENVTTRGLSPSAWRIGQTYRVGTARVELTSVRVPCRTIRVYGANIDKFIHDADVKSGDTASRLWAFSGIYARVVTEGSVRAGDPIELVSELA